MAPEELAQALRNFADEPAANQLAPAIVTAARAGEIKRTGDLVRVIQQAIGAPARWKLHPKPGKWNLHPAARRFRRCASSSTASWRTWSSFSACCQAFSGTADGPRSSAFTAAKTGS